MADARVDNRRELRASLGLDKWKALPDGELVLFAYERWGEGCVEHLVGDFAFAIWDPRVRRLFCARDHFGMRPLFYYYDPGRLFVFGTEIKVLLAAPGVPRRLDEVCIGNYLANIRDDIEPTIYEGVRRLPNAYTLTVDERGLHPRSYYELQPASDVHFRSNKAYAERFAELLEEAVQCRIRSDYPVGSHLSGGLDSSSIACLARDGLRREGRGPLHTFSLIFDESSESDEREYIEEVLAQGGMEPHFVQGDGLGPLSNLEELYGFLDEHLVAGPQHLAWLVTKKAGEVGVRVVLDGLDGDNTVSHGELYLQELARRGEWAEFAEQGKKLAERYRGASHRQAIQEQISSFPFLFSAMGLPELESRAEQGSWVTFVRQLNEAHHHIPFDRTVFIRSVWKKLAVPYGLIEWRRRRKGAGEKPLLPFVDPDFADRTGLYERYRQYAGEPSRSGVREHQRHSLSRRRRVTSLETSNIVAAYYGIEAAHPFYDKRLLEYCLALPPEQSLYDGWTRLILRRAMSGVLPDRVAWRVGKAVMEPNFRRGLFEIDRERFRKMLQELGPLEHFVDVTAIERAWVNAASLPERQLVELARLATLAYWLNRRFGRDDEVTHSSGTLRSVQH